MRGWIIYKSAWKRNSAKFGAEESGQLFCLEH
jgi:hypothetical protein